MIPPRANGPEHHRVPGGFHGFQFLDPLFDREFALVVVIFSEEVTVFATQVAAVGYVDGTDCKLRQAENEQPGHLTELAQFSTDVHPLRLPNTN